MKDYYGLRAFLEAEYGSRGDLELVIVAPTVRPAESIEVRGADPHPGDARRSREMAAGTGELDPVLSYLDWSIS